MTLNPIKFQFISKQFVHSTNNPIKDGSETLQVEITQARIITRLNVLTRYKIIN